MPYISKYIDKWEGQKDLWSSPVQSRACMGVSFSALPVHKFFTEIFIAT